MSRSQRISPAIRIRRSLLLLVLISSLSSLAFGPDRALADGYFYAGEAGIVITWDPGVNIAGYTVTLYYRWGNSGAAQSRPCTVAGNGASCSYTITANDF